MYLLALEDISRDLGLFSFSSRWEGGEKGGLILRFTMIFLYRDLVEFRYPRESKNCLSFHQSTLLAVKNSPIYVYCDGDICVF